MAGRKKKFTIPNEYKLIIFLFIPLLLLPLYMAFMDVFGELLARILFAVIIFWIGYRFFKKARSVLSLKKMSRDHYKRFLKSVAAKIPSVVWGGFAVFGILLFGIFLGAALAEEEQPEYFGVQDAEYVSDYKDVISSYRTISKLYYLQGEDMDIITNFRNWELYPEEVYEAIDSYHQKKDEIIFEYGKLYEIMQRANLPADTYLKTE